MAGALGEVGTSVARALAGMGHVVVPVSGRAPLSERPDVFDLDTAAGLVRGAGVDGVVVASGRGDRRETARTRTESTVVLASAAREGGVPSVLLSTTRVLEGAERVAGEDAAPAPLTPYARANADNEHQWRRSGGATVLRIANYFCEPSTPDSPQRGLLPWSLVDEALDHGMITVRSGPSLAKEFVDAADVAAAVVLLLESPQRPDVCATMPGSRFTMRDLADAAGQGLVAAGLTLPVVTFGADDVVAGGPVSGWLMEHGWAARLNVDVIADSIRAWVLQSRS